MEMVWKSFRRSFESLFSLKVLMLLAIPPVLSLILWSGIFWSYWTELVLNSEGFTKSVLFFDFWQRTFPSLSVLGTLFHGLSIFFIILFFIPLIYLTSVLLTSFLVVPYLAILVSREDYPHLEKKYGGSLWGSVWNTVISTIRFLLIFLMVLPLWLIPGVQIITPIFLMAWLNRRVFVYDSLQDFASKEERELIMKDQSLKFFIIGLINGMMTYLPLLFLLTPFLTTLSFLHLSLSSLEELRKNNSGKVDYEKK